MDSARTRGCITPSRAIKEVRLSATSISETSSLLIPISLLTEDGLFSFSPPPIFDSGKLFSPNGLLPVSPVAPTPLSSFPPVPLSDTSVLSSNTKTSDDQYHALVDSGSSDCFIDEKFMTKNNLSTYLVTPLALHLFDGTTNSVITEAVDIRLHFASS